MWDTSLFQTPPAFNTVSYFWLLSNKLEPSDLIAQIREMASKNSRCLCPHPLPRGFRYYNNSRMEPDYLTEEYFESYRAIVDESARTGGICYLYDEGGWPSGSACGQVYASDPERFAQRYLELDGQGGYKISTRFFDPAYTKAVLPNLLMREVTDKFIELTHEKYYRHFGEHFGKTFLFSFMDEPSLSLCERGVLPWTWDIFDEFKKRKGYDPEPFIVNILKNLADLETSRARDDYADVVSQLFVERFLRPIKEWCRAHGIESGGHFSDEDAQENAIYHCHGGRTMRALRELDLPGVDVIWRQLWPNWRLNTFPKFASSAANQTGKKHVLGEMFAIYGAGITLQQMKFLIDYMISFGINLFVFSHWTTDTSGPRMRAARPNLGPINPMWHYMKEFNDYTARLSCLATSGRPVVKTALFYDTISLWQTKIKQRCLNEQYKVAHRLLEQQSDFDYIDDDLLASAVYRNGKIIAGEAEYTTLVISDTAMMTPEAGKNLARLRSDGATIISPDRTDEAPRTLQVDPPDWRLQVRKIDCDDSNVIYFVVNISGAAVTRTFTAEEKSAVARCDAESGKILRVDSRQGEWQWDFAPFDSAAFIIGPAAETAQEPDKMPGRAVRMLDANWQLKRIFEYRVGKEDYESFAIDNDPWQDVSLGDWRKVVPEDFSGDVLYRTEFFVEDVKNIAFLDLGKVNYAAETCLNGTPLGKRIFAPFRYKVENILKQGKNILEIRITNTLANTISSERVNQYWNEISAFDSPYEDRQRFFELDSLESGLFGPVTLLEIKQ